ncbi:MAG: heparinase II/III family protein [Lachnospiraceae bacterium]|nr:heparinase II/III family protein [Lachnospiraceae bacterium]
MRQQETEYLKKFWAEIEQTGEVLRMQELPKLTREDFFLFHETGNRLVYEKAYFGRRKFLTVFGILAEFRGKQEDVEKLEEILAEVCEERFWALPAHVNFAHLDEDTIDLFAAETAQTLAEMLEIFKDRLSRELIERVQGEIMRRVLIPFCSSTFPYSGWETDRCNWSAVCAGSVGMAAIYMHRQGVLSEEWKEACIRRVCAALQCYLEGMEEDGACTEGLGYYNYGMSYYTAFAELLYEETKGNIRLMEQPKCEKIAAFQEKCYFGKGVSVSFSDGSARESFLPGLTAYLAHCYPATQTPDYSVAHFLEDDACYRWIMNERNIRWLLQYAKEENAQTKVEAQTLTAAYLPSAQWMICKDKHGNGFAAKGGHNAESHNHNDIGHFLCVYDGSMLLADLGAGEYTRDYFGAGRYEILCNRSLGHSVPLINDCEQCAGGEYRAGAFEWSEEKKELSISFAEAYPSGCVERLERRIWMEALRADKDTEAEQVMSLSKEELRMTVLDCFVPSVQTKKIVENLITPYEPRITATGKVELQAPTECKINIAYHWSEEEWQQAEGLCVVPMEHALHDGTKTTVYLIQWEVPVVEKNTSECRIEICMRPKGEV